MSDVRPLPGRKATPAETAVEPEPEAISEPDEKRARERTADPAPARRADSPAKIAQLPRLSPGHAPGLDKRRALRLRRGQIPVEASIDLHGFTQDQAERELMAFLARAQEAGRRCVLVITGKGTTKDEGGVLRAMAPHWLNQPPNRARILAFDTAQPKDGGQGALYVLLRRTRQVASDFKV